MRVTNNFQAAWAGLGYGIGNVHRVFVAPSTIRKKIRNQVTENQEANSNRLNDVQNCRNKNFLFTFSLETKDLSCCFQLVLSSVFS